MYEIKKKNRPWLDALFTVDPESTFSTMARPPSLSIAFTSTREQPSGADALGPRSLSLKVGEQLRPAVLGVILLTLLTGCVFPLGLLALGHFLFPGRTDGRLLTRGGSVIGSEFIAQDFTRLEYFQPCPSVAGAG
jgi:hypothetical protein